MNIIKFLKNIKSKFNTKVFEDADCRECCHCVNSDVLHAIKEEMKIKEGLYIKCVLEVDEDGLTFKKGGLVCLAKIEANKKDKIVSVSQSLINEKEHISKGVCESYTPDMISQVGVQIFRIITLIFNKNIRNIFNNNEKKKLKRVD